MATKIKEPEYEVSVEEFQEAVEKISNYYAERKVGFALVDTASILAFWQGLPLSVESALKHAHDLIEFETKQAIMIRLGKQKEEEAIQKVVSEATKEQN